MLPGRTRPDLPGSIDVLSLQALVTDISSIIKRRMAAVPVGDALECIARRHQAGLIEMAANELEGERIAAFGKATREGDGPTFRHVEGTSEEQQNRDQVRSFAQRRH